MKKFGIDSKVALNRSLDPKDTYWKGYGFDKAVVKGIGKKLYKIVGDEGTGHPLYVKENEITGRK